MVFNRKDLAKAFSPNKLKVRTHRRLSGGQKQKPSTDGSTSSTAVQSVTEIPNSPANVKVVVRVRPPSDRENQDNYRTVIKVVDDKMLIFDPKEEANPFFFQGIEQKRRDLLKKQNKEMEFIFDKVFNITSINVDVFEDSTKNIISSLLDGYNCSVFVYGATGAGKTHTMLGKEGDPGITYLTMTELFRQMDVFRDQREFNLGVSYLEIYNENVQDLLHKSSPLHIREDGKSGIIVAGLKIVTINDADELLALLAKGNKNRTQHPTDANEESSRSHAVFQIYVNITNKLDGQIRQVKLSMIDLAGSERASATGCKGARFKEGANINKSLLALGNCINNLADGLKHIPYRDSKLTRLLKDSLGGNCHTVMIANVSPSSLSYEDTYNTLRYANRAKKIKTNVKKNIISRQMHITSYIKLVEEQKKEIDMLKQRILASENMADQVTPSVKAAPITAKLVDEDDSPEWNKKLSDLYTKKKLVSIQILSLESSDKILCCRIQNKYKASLRLQELSSGINTLDVDSPAETNTNCMKRIEKSMNCFERQRESNQLMMKSLWSDLQAIEEEIEKLIADVEAKRPKNLNHTIASCKIDLGDCMLTQQLEHAKKLCNLHESEMDSLSANVQLLSGTLQKFYNLMHGSGILTDAIKTDFKQLIKSLEGVKSIKWSDSELTNDQQQLHDLSHLSVELLLNPIGHDLLPLPNIHLDREIKNIPAKQPLDATFATDSAKTELTTSNNAETSYDDKEDSSLKPDTSDDEDNMTNTNSINIEQLNNTFTLMKAKAQKRALMDKNHVASKPSASKHARKVIVDSKKTSVLQNNNNNNNAGKENKSVKSVMSVKSIEILNRIKNDRKTSAPNLMVPFAVQSNSMSLKPNTDSSKVVAGNRRRVLTTNSHPNNRANEKQKATAAAPSSRVPW